MKICVVVPVYNEEKIIKGNLETILAYAARLPVLTHVVAVNDGSTDGSGDILIELSLAYSPAVFSVISHMRNEGYGAAQKTGARFAVSNEFDYIIFMDSDLTDHPKYLEDFYIKITEGYEYIKTTRRALNGGYSHVPWERRIVALLGNKIARLITGLPLSDITNGFRCVKSSVINNIVLVENGFPIIIEELMKAKRLTGKFCEIPRVQGNRSEFAKPSLFKYNFKTYWKYFKYLFI